MRMLALAGLVGCSDPGFICEQNRAYVTWDGKCEFAPSAITIDGDLSDWNQLQAYYEPDCTTCENGAVQGIYVAETTNGEVAIYAKTVGAPLTDSRHSYYLALGPLVLPHYVLAFRVTPAGAQALVDSTLTVDGIAVRSAIGPTGVELAVPISALPFTSGATAFGQLEVLEFGSWRYAQFETPYLATVCWEPDAQLCKPTRHSYGMGP